MVLGRPNLGRILIQNRVITEEELQAALQHQATAGCRLGQALVAQHICSDRQIALALAEQLETPFVDLDETPPLPDCIALIPREVALEHGVLPVRMEGRRLLVAARDPFDIRVDEAVRQAAGTQVILAIAPEVQLRELLQQYYYDGAIDETASHGPDGLEPSQEDEDQQVAVEKLAAAGQQLSAVRIVHTLIADAVRRGASDLHIEPEGRGIRVRYRIDGRLVPVVTLDRSLLQSVVSRIKIMSAMDIAETRKPQDGHCCVRLDGREVELRCSTLRGVHGEIVVLRILGSQERLQSLDALGFEPEVLRGIRRLLAARQGLILIAGPTGSGKSTSLYAALDHLNRDDINIITVEDPVEVKRPGINQIQVHDRAGRSFATTLRSMLRQDPDILMVGEMRDAETAEIACRAALTGHLVLSTVHTQHALGTVARLFDMGVAPWMVAACLNGILAQRLVRRVCEHCAEPYMPPRGVLRALETQFGRVDGAHFCKGSGCVECEWLGTQGRVGVHELLTIDNELRQLLADTASPNRRKLRDSVLKRGFTTMEEDAYRKACRGLIPPEEIIGLGFEVAKAMGETDEAADELTAVG